ncbi:MAG TPA: GNAT family N-acetyltransferase [Gaiellaceae bacterium]|jgi:mycothiol synthase|nr:GNAT family N-acetyltransferase [Gaiellaceae bacterium]
MNIRPFVEADAPTVAALISAEEERLYGRPGRITAADILMFLQYSKESWVWEEDGRMVASASYGVHGDAANTRGAVADKGRGLGTEIVERGEAFARAEGAKKILAAAPEPDDAARELFEQHGYREVRRFYEMAIELTGEPPAPALPEGLVVDELRDDEYRAFFDALNEAFAEHWEWHPEPFEDWLGRRQGQHRDEHGPVWFVVRDGDELAAVTRNDASVAGGGYVGAIGVRPAWRGKGLGKALLYRTFAEFWRRGTTRVTLDVDTQNETGAVALYERVGMRVDSCGVAFEKPNE